MNDNAPNKRRRWLTPLLFVSLAANLLVIGIVVGWFASNDGPRGSEWRTVRGLIGEPFIRSLPKEHRRALIREALSDDMRIHESREDLRQRFEAFLAALRDDPFDAQTARALLHEQRKAALDRQDMGEDLLLKRLESMTAAERRAYADALERALKRPRR